MKSNCVRSWAHLGRIVSSTMDDKNDIVRSCHNLIGKLSEVLSMLKNIVWVYIYGCELWNLHHTSLEIITCKSWQSAIENAWYGVTEDVSIECYRNCHRCRSIVRYNMLTCSIVYQTVFLSSDSDVVRYVVRGKFQIRSNHNYFSQILNSDILEVLLDENMWEEILW